MYSIQFRLGGVEELLLLLLVIADYCVSLGRRPSAHWSTDDARGTRAAKIRLLSLLRELRLSTWSDSQIRSFRDGNLA